MIPESLDKARSHRTIVEDLVTAAPVAELMAAFDREHTQPVQGDPLPHLWHGLFCTPKPASRDLGPDGLPAESGMPPQIPEFPNRLFGGARYRFRRLIRIGDVIRRESSILSLSRKEGQTGAMIIAVVEHRIYANGELAIMEENDILLRPDTVAASPASGSSPAPESATDALWSRTITPDPVLMFRHSTVTFNRHRIHYDRDYARSRGFPGLMVQGTLIARLMLELVYQKRPDFEPGSFSFRSRSAIYDDGDFTLLATPADRTIALRAKDHTGRVSMTARADPLREG